MIATQAQELITPLAQELTGPLRNSWFEPERVPTELRALAATLRRRFKCPPMNGAGRVRPRDAREAATNGMVSVAMRLFYKYPLDGVPEYLEWLANEIETQKTN